MDEEKTKKPIGSGDQPPPVDATVSASVSTDGMRCDLILTPPENNGKRVTLDMAREALAQKNVVFGIDESALRQFIFSPVYNTPVAVANGLPPVNGEPAVIKQLIRTEHDLRPKELPDGSVDYKDLGIIHSVRQGDVLCVKTPLTPGTPGTTVLGAAIPPKPGKDMLLPAGKNTVISEDKLQLLAACDGQADVANRKIQVLNTFNVKGNVCNATGNISFLGHVVVEGSVLTGFMVQATGNININGSVEGAQIVAGGNIILKEGINGSGKGLVQAGGYIKAKYIQSGTVHAAGDIETAHILHSTVQSGGVVRLVGSKGMVIGGRITALKSIDIISAGGRGSYVPTTLEVGTDPALIARSREIPREMENLKRDSAALLRVINLLAEYKKAGRITPDKLESLQRAIISYQAMQQTMLELEDDLQNIQDTLAASGFGTVNIKGTAYPGVRIVIGSEHFLLESNYDHCTFVRGDQGITMGPLR